MGSQSSGGGGLGVLMEAGPPSRGDSGPTYGKTREEAGRESTLRGPWVGRRRESRAGYAGQAGGQ